MEGKKVILFVGPPGAGKSTIGTKLGAILNIPHISTGEIIRSEISSGSEMGIALQEYVINGTLAPPEITDEIIIKRFACNDCNKGFILDGYPRTIEQIKDVKKLLNRINAKITEVIYLDINKDLALKRLIPRGRKDDKFGVIEKRYDIFLNDTLPMIEVFRKKNILFTLDATLNENKILDSIVLYLNY